MKDDKVASSQWIKYSALSTFLHPLSFILHPFPFGETFMKFLFLLLDNIYLDALENAAEKLRRELKLSLEIKTYLCKDLKDGSEGWADFEKDLAASDFF